MLHDPAVSFSMFQQARDVAALKTAFLSVLDGYGYGAFDAWSVRAETLRKPLVPGNFAIASYDIGLVRRYVSDRIIEECSAIHEAGLSHEPFDYLQHLADRSDEKAALWQLRLLKVFGVRHAWIVPLSTVNRNNGVTCYMGRIGPDSHERFLATRDAIHVASTYFFSALEKLEPDLPDDLRGRSREVLTAREASVVAAAGAGQTTAAIAATLGISENTVRFHFKNVFRKLNVKTRAQAVQKAALLPHSTI